MSEDINERSKKMIQFFNSWKGKELKDFAKSAYATLLTHSLFLRFYKIICSFNSFLTNLL